MSNPAPPLSQKLVNTRACAEALGMSVSWLEKDRNGRRLVPHYRIGRVFRYDVQHVREALQNAGGCHAC